MFYDDYCHTDVQRQIFKSILELSKSSLFISIQELDYLGIPRKEVEETLIYFEKNGLFSSIQHLGETFPVIFSLKT